MKTVLTGFLVLIVIILAIAAIIWWAVKLINLSSNHDSDLEHPWPADTPVEIRFKMDKAWENWVLQVRKLKKFRLSKDSGWKNVLLYYKWCGPRYTWNQITWPVGINQFMEYETMKSFIRTYADLDNYYGLTRGYNEYMKQTFEEK